MNFNENRSFGQSITKQVQNCITHYIQNDRMSSNMPSKSGFGQYSNAKNVSNIKPVLDFCGNNYNNQENQNVAQIHIAANQHSKTVSIPNQYEQSFNSKSKVVNDMYFIQCTPVNKHNKNAPLYSNAIINNMRISENNIIDFYDFDYLEHMKYVKEHMRHSLIDWLVDVHRNFNLSLPTLYLTINLLDRFLSNKISRNINSCNLQLIGCCCLWIAAKYHEIFSPEIKEFIQVSNKAFSAEDMASAETQIMKILKFVITVPTVYNYISKYTNILVNHMINSNNIYHTNGKHQQIIKSMILMCVEYACVSYKLCRIKPSLVSAAVFVFIGIGMQVFKIPDFDNLCAMVGYKKEELAEVLKILYEVINEDIKNKAFMSIYRKYGSTKFDHISHQCDAKNTFGNFNVKYFMNVQKMGKLEQL